MCSLPQESHLPQLCKKYYPQNCICHSECWTTPIVKLGFQFVVSYTPVKVRDCIFRWLNAIVLEKSVQKMTERQTDKHLPKHLKTIFVLASAAAGVSKSAHTTLCPLVAGCRHIFIHMSLACSGTQNIILYRL